MTRVRTNQNLSRVASARRNAHHCNKKTVEAVRYPSPPLTVHAVAGDWIVDADYSSDESIVGTPFKKGLLGQAQKVSPGTKLVVTSSSRALTAFEVMKAVSLALSVITDPLSQKVV